MAELVDEDDVQQPKRLDAGALECRTTIMKEVIGDEVEKVLPSNTSMFGDEQISFEEYAHPVCEQWHYL